MHLTLKNYRSPHGLSAKIHAQKVTEGVSTHMMEHADESVNADDILALYRTGVPNVEFARTMQKTNVS